MKPDCSLLSRLSTITAALFLTAQGEIKGAEIDELATQAKEKTDKLVPQIEQSAAVTGVKITG